MIRIGRTFRALRRGENKESGFSLAELLVAIVILGFLLAMSGTILAFTGNAIQITQGTAQGAGTASNIMDELSNVIRSGTAQPVINQLTANPPFLVATNESLTMYSYVDSYTSATNTTVRPQIVQFTLSTTGPGPLRQLIEKRWLPTATNGTYFTFPTLAQLATTTPNWQRNFGGPLLTTPSGGSPLFVYLTANCTVPSNPSTCTAVSNPTTATFSTIASIEVTVRVAGAAKAARPNVVLQNIVNIPNIALTGN
jgi:prepilin-type N-terminal cleavage/methylation domain-containing protein